MSAYVNSKKKPGRFRPGFRSFRFLREIWVFVTYANGRIESAGTLRVLQQQHAHARPTTNITAEIMTTLGRRSQLLASGKRQAEGCEGRGKLSNLGACAAGPVA